MTDSALAPPLAVIVVPSRGSRAISIGGPLPVPTFSPMYSIGASSRSPSPMTTVPSMARLLRAKRIASTAAWSAAFSSPRPMRREAERAAASVTRTASRARLRSITAVLSIVPPSACFSFGVLEILDADHARRLQHGVQAADPVEGAAHRRLFGEMGREHDRHGFARRAPPLDHGFERDLLVAERRRDVGDDAGPVDDHETDVIGALMVRHRRRGPLAKRARRHAEGRGAPAGRDVDDVGNDRGGGRPRPGAAPFEDDPAGEVAFRDDGVEDALDMGDGRRARHHAGMNALLDAVLRQAREAEQLDAVAELGGEIDVDRGNVADAFDMDAGEIDLAAEGDA